MRFKGTYNESKGECYGIFLEENGGDLKRKISFHVERRGNLKSQKTQQKRGREI